MRDIVAFLFYRLLSDITRLETKVERLEGQLQAKDREIATITRTVRNFYFKKREVLLFCCFIDLFGFCIRKPKPRRPLRPKLKSCSRSEMSFKEWSLVTRLGDLGI